MNRLFIIDPSLKDIRGHHYMMTRAATLSAQKQNFDVHWLCSKDFGGELMSDGATVAPTFSASMYQNYMAKKEEAAPSFLQRVVRRLTGGGAAAAPQKVDQTAAFHADLLTAMKRFEIGANDRLFLHTADGASFLGIARIVAELPAEDLPVFHVATPYDPVGVMPNRDNADDIAAALSSLNEKGLIDKKLFLYAENPYLAAHLAELWSIEVRPLDVPVYPNDPEKIERAKRFRRDTLGLDDDMFVIVSLGSARMEKGFFLIPDVVRRTFEFAGGEDFPNADPQKIKYVLHASPQIVGRDPVIVKAIEKLEEMPSSQVSLMLEPLSEEDYQSLLLASDVVLMPYNEKDYRVRGSTIVSEAVAAEKIIVAKDGSYPGKAAKDFGGETGALPIEMAKGVLKIASAQEDYKARAAAYARDYIDANGIDTYWRKCLETERAQG
ncbi:MAG: hypothetical protein AAGA09_08695 [Pseudomonadota bacterium]